LGYERSERSIIRCLVKLWPIQGRAPAAPATYAVAHRASPFKSFTPGSDVRSRFYTRLRKVNCPQGGEDHPGIHRTRLYTGAPPEIPQVLIMCCDVGAKVYEPWIAAFQLGDVIRNEIHAVLSLAC
jgi:hypothetical protein